MPGYSSRNLTTSRDKTPLARPLIVATLIVAEGSLAFLGLGLQEPQPTWGNMIAEGNLTVLRQHPHIPLVPGVFMFLTVLSFNRVGERARSLWDTREAQI